MNSGSWWWTGRPCMLQFMGSQRVGHDWATELNWRNYIQILWSDCILSLVKLLKGKLKLLEIRWGLKFSSLRGYVVVQSLDHVWLFVTPWNAAFQASLSSTIAWSLLKFMSIDSMRLSNHLILCFPLILLPSIFPSIRVFSNVSAVHIKWPEFWNLSISPSNEYSGLISFRID